MQVDLAYGKTGLTVEIPEHADVSVFTPTDLPGLDDPLEAIREALMNPAGSKPLSQLVSSSDRVAVIFSDVTRPTPNHLLIPPILEQLSHIPDDQIVLCCATGTHRPDTEEELHAALGEAVMKRYKVIQNDAHDPATQLCVGTSSRGNRIMINRAVAESDKKILTGFIEPHFFAGFSGGGKAIMPGMAGLETILRNHCPENLDDPRCSWGITEGNPVWEEIMEIAERVGADFLLNVSLNRKKAITGVFAGALQTAYQAGVSFVRNHAMVPLEQLFDIVITSNSGHPLDLNMYQSVKGISAAARACRPGGHIIMAANCWDGIPDHGLYGKLLREAESPEALLETIHSGMLACDMWQAQIHANLCKRFTIHFFSEHLSDEQIRSAFFQPCHDIAALIGRLLDENPAARICVLPDGPQTIPYFAG